MELDSLMFVEWKSQKRFRLSVENFARAVGKVERVARLASLRLKYVYNQWNNVLSSSPFYCNKSHDIIVPLVWASTVTFYVDISVTFTSVYRSKTLSPFTIIHMQVVNVWLQICFVQWANSIKIAT